MSRKISTLATLAVTLFCANVTSLGLFDGCSSGCWEVGAEALYWQPCLCPFEYATLTGPTPSNITDPQPITAERVKPGSDWGYRIWVGMEDGCFFSTLGWTYLKAADTSSVARSSTNEILAGAFGLTSLERATGRTRTRYNKINWRAGYYLHQGCDIAFYAFAGLRYVDIESTQSIKGSSATDGASRSAEEQTKWHGPAVEVGFGADYHIGCGFHLAGYLGAVGGVGQQKLHQKAVIEGGTDSETNYNTYTNCIPGFELRLGFNYTYACGCVELTGEIGYEIDHYFGALARQCTNGSNNTSSCIDVGFAGPYIGLGICF